MSKLRFGASDKQRIEEVINEITNVPEYERDAFLEKFAQGRGPAWKRFVKAAYNQPITWWIGVIQCQMQMGIWGQRHKGNALARASLFSQITKPIRDEMLGLPLGGDAPKTKKVFVFCRRYFKTEFVARTAAGFFTNYASTGGRAGQRVIPRRGHAAMALTNFAVAGYGAAIQAIANGMTSQEAVLQSIFIGQASDIAIDMGDGDIVRTGVWLERG